MITTSTLFVGTTSARVFKEAGQHSGWLYKERSQLEGLNVPILIVVICGLLIDEHEFYTMIKRAQVRVLVELFYESGEIRVTTLTQAIK